MVTMGDVLAVLGLLFGVCISGWAMIVGAGLIFMGRAGYARQKIESHPFRSVFRGLILTIIGGVGGVVMIATPNPLIKLVGWMLVMLLIGFSVIGATGLAFIVGERIKASDPEASEFKAFSRGAAIIVVSCLLPLFGWFVFAPLVMVLGVGAGTGAVLNRKREEPAVTLAP